MPSPIRKITFLGLSTSSVGVTGGRAVETLGELHAIREIEKMSRKYKLSTDSHKLLTGKRFDGPFKFKGK